MSFGDFLGGGLNAWSTNEANKDNIKYQKQFAQRGIRWRVKDAKAAGVHPLFALGANTASFSPSVSAPDYSFVGDAVNSMAQRREAKKAEKLALAEFDLSRRKTEAEINLLNAQAAKMMPGAGRDAGGSSNNGKDVAPSATPGPQVPGFKIHGVPQSFNPDTTDASVYEDRYGDLVGGVAGAAVLASDLIAHGQMRLEQGIDYLVEKYKITRKAAGEAIDKAIAGSPSTHNKRRSTRHGD